MEENKSTEENKDLNVDDFIKAASKGDLDKVKKFIEHGFDTNTKDQYGTTALMEAANGHFEMVNCL